LLVEAGTSFSKDDPLSDIDQMLRAVRARDWQLAEDAAFDVDAGLEFLEQFSRSCETEVRPVMEAVATRLSIYGGGGMVEMRRGGDPRSRSPRLTMWLSLQEEIIGTPSPERHACLSIEANADRRNISITSSFGSPEAREDQITTWQLADLTQENVTKELTEIIRRLVTSL
jgi:hypothetical protein